MKTILFKIWKFPQLSETFIVNQIITAIKLEYDVKILVGELNELTGNANNSLFKKYNLLDKVIIENYKIPKNRFLRYLKALFLLLKNLANLRLLLKYCNLKDRKGLLPLFEFDYYKRFRDIHAIHIQFGTNKHPVDDLKLIGFLKSKLILSFHGHDLYFPINGKIINNGYYNNLFLSADYLISNTPFIEEKLKKLKAPISKIKIIPVAVDTEFFSPSLVDSVFDNGINIITVGRLAKFKGQIWGLKAAAELIIKGYAINYTILGDGDQRSILQNEISELGIDNYVKFIGPTSQEEIRKHLQKSDIFLMTSITDPDYGVESQGLVTAEAQACGLPVVAFDSGGIKYTIQNNVTGFLCPEKDIDCYVSKLRRLLDNPKLRMEMGENARKFIEAEYSENSVLTKWKELYG